jgi:hypothetical protein
MSQTTTVPVIEPIGEILGFPLFLGKTSKDIENIEALGHNVFFILGYEEYDEQGQTAKIRKSRPALFKVLRNFTGRCIQPVTDKALGLNQKLQEQATFTLPRISWQLIEKMDQFFREVFKLHGTESIVILTYDPEYLDHENPSLGWGCIAPKQENTAGHCNYTLDEDFMAVKPEHVHIVGSVHSHPEMAAFASGTDHADQKDFDGIHITYGWSKNGPTEYYIEFVIAGSEWVCKPEQVFEPAPRPELDVAEEIKGWIDNVSKKTYTHTSSSTSSSRPLTSSSHRPHQSSITTPTNKFRRGVNIPPDWPAPSDVTYIATVARPDHNGQHNEPLCLLCGVPLLDYSIEQGRCFACKGFVAYEDEKVDEFAQRFSDNNPTRGADLARLSTVNADKPIRLIWGPPDDRKISEDLRTESAKK